MFFQHLFYSYIFAWLKVRSSVRTIKIFLIVSTIIAVTCDKAVKADSYEAFGLKPAAIIVSSRDWETYRAVLEIVRNSDARGLICYPPGLIFGRFSPGISEADFDGLPVEIIRQGTAIVQGNLDTVIYKIVDRLLNERETILKEPRGSDPGPYNGLVLNVPDDLKEKFKGRPKPRTGSPSEILERGIQQNSELMIGEVLVNVVIPESNGGTEDWTQEEIGNMLADLQLGLSQYTQNSGWASLNFYINTDIPRQIPVSVEPIEGDWNTDWRWISDALTYLSTMGLFTKAEVGSIGNTHLLNNATRRKWLDDGFRIDWVFTAYVVDASFNECWQGAGGGYVAYAYLGGPYIVVPYPACRFGTGIYFGHVFIHEMSHSFWALDEYASYNGPCSETSGYLDITNGNSYYIPMGQNEPCGAGYSCIMNNARLESPLPICPYTMGQVGRGDFNENSIPDIYEIPPIVEMIEMPGVTSDTTYNGLYLVSAVARNAAVPNNNWRQEPGTRVDYAPYLSKGWITINDKPIGDLSPGDGIWDESQEDLSFFLESGLEPGQNWIYLKVENCVGLTGEGSVNVTYIGIKYYQKNISAGSDYIDLSWKTADDVFGSDFEIFREDISLGTGDRLLAVVKGGEYEESSGGRNYYLFRDENVLPGNSYRYHILGTIKTVIDGEPVEYLHDSGNLYEVTTVPVTAGMISPLVPNPLTSVSDKILFTIKIPGDFGTVVSADIVSGGRGTHSSPAVEEKIFLEVAIYNVMGQKVRNLYSMPLFGGQYKNMEWDGKNDRGESVSNGIYFIRTTAGNKEQTKKIVVLR